MKILFIDDEVVTTTLSKEGLEKLGHEVYAFTSSKEALNVFKDSPKDFNLVITDKNMPNLNGLDLCVEIKKINAEVPVMILTGFLEDGGQEKMMNVGVDKFLLKPVSLKNINSAIKELLINKV